MNTLYDILGIGRQATQSQIEQGYNERLNSLKNEDSGKTAQDDIALMTAIKEAYMVLSTPARRQAYDAKLKAASSVVRYEVVEGHSIPWLTIVVVVSLLFAGGLYVYKSQQEKARIERLRLETLQAEKLKAAARLAEELAAAEQARLDREMTFRRQQTEEAQRREVEQARREGEQIHEQLQQADARSAREKEQAERQAKYDAIREEQAAHARSRSQTSALQRALDIPIPRH